MWHWRKNETREVCESDVRSWMDRCVRALGGSPIRWWKLSAAQKMLNDKRDQDDRMIDAIVEEVSRALATPQIQS